MNTFMDDQQEHAATLARFAVAIADALGDGWTVGTSNGARAQYIRHEDGRALHLSTAPSLVIPGRVRITGVIKDAPGTILDRPHITAGITLPAARVAAYIRRRLLPDYEERLSVARDIAAKEAEIRAERERVAGLLRDTYPGLAREVQGRPVGSFTLDASRGSRRVRAEVTDTVDGVRVDLNLGGITTEAAVAVLAALRAAGRR